MTGIVNTLIIYDKIDINFFEFNVNSQILIENAAEKNGIKTIVSNLKGSKRKKIELFYKDSLIGDIKGLNISTTNKAARKLCKDKYILEKFLSKYNMNVLNSSLFQENDKNRAIKLLDMKNNEKLVIKPTTLSGGRGIETNISNEEFSEAWDRCFSVQKEQGIKSPECLVQKHIEGYDIRISIIEGVYAAAEIRFPPHIVGDGKNSIMELINKKNVERSKLSYFKTKPIVVNNIVVENLKKEGISLQTVLQKEEVFILNKISNMVMGGESIDITNELSNEIREEAIRAVAAIPGLHSASVDMMCESYSKGNGYIIEVNTNGNHTQHHVPYKGIPQAPFNILMLSLITKYKLRNGMELTSAEKNISKEIFKFIELKNLYSTQLI